MRALKGVVCVCLVLPVTLSLLCFGCASHRESVALEMSWKRGDDHYGPNFIHLESGCLSNPETGWSCALDFKATTSKDFADYIGSFGTKKVPVKLSRRLRQQSPRAWSHSGKRRWVARESISNKREVFSDGISDEQSFGQWLPQQSG